MFHTAAPGKKSQECVKGNEADDKEEGAAHLEPLDSRSDQNEDGNRAKEKEETNIPEKQSGHEKTPVEREPRTGIEGLDERAFSFAITPGDKHIGFRLVAGS
jgi:hypothetical protein